jgi:nucleoside-diphosphate-sugar epimerase
MDKKTILITGAAGHIGSRLIRGISRAAVERVVMLDNMESQRYPSLFDLPRDMAYRFVEGDIRTADFVAVFSTYGVGAVVHLAALTDAANSAGRAQEVMDVNLEGLKRVAMGCRAAGIPLFFPSTTSVYGSQAERVDETCAELKPQSPYAESKLRAEEYLASQKADGLRFAVCRLGTIFGWSRGMRFHTAVNKFTWQAVNGMPITVWKTAWRQRRPYLDLGDCVSAINFILERDLFDGEIYNVVTGNRTVEEIVGAIKTFIPALEVSYVDSPIMNQLSYDVDDAKFRALGFVPGGDLHSGIGEAIDKLRGIVRQ